MGIQITRAQTHEEVVCIRAEAADFEELHHIPELAMNVSAYLERVGGEWMDLAIIGERILLLEHQRPGRLPPR